MRQQFQMISLLERCIKDKEANNDGLKSYLITLKQKLREQLKQESQPTKHGKEFDEYWTKEVLKMTEADAIDYMEYDKINYWDRGYDCTGQWFTTRQKLFKIGKNTFLYYHFVSMDC